MVWGGVVFSKRFSGKPDSVSWKKEFVWFPGMESRGG